MKIYIEEAGAFDLPSGPRPISLVLALIVPGESEVEILYEFLRMRDTWPDRGVAIRGDDLDESQAAQVIQLLGRYQVLVNFFAIDLAAHSDQVIDDFKIRRADGVVANLTAEHGPEMAADLQALAGTIREMPNHLFVKAFLTIELVMEIIKEAPL